MRYILAFLVAFALSTENLQAIQIKPFKPDVPEHLVSLLDSIKYAGNNQKYAEAFEYLRRLKTEDPSGLNPKIQAVVTYWEGRLYFYLQYYDRAEMLLLRSAEHFRNTNQQHCLALTYYLLGQVMESAKTDYYRELSYFQSALGHATLVKDTFRMICTYDAIGCTWAALKNYENAINSSLQAEKLMMVNVNDYLEPNIYTNMGNYYLHLNDLKQAETLLKKSISHYDNGYTAHISLINDAYRLLGTVYLKMGRRTEGLAYLEKALVYCRNNIEDPLIVPETYQALIDDAKSHGDYKKAFDYQHEFTSLRDSLSNKQLLLRLSLNETLLEVNAKENERELLEQSLDAQRKQSRFILGFSIMLGALLIAVIYMYWQKKNFNVKLKQEVELQTKEIIEKHIELERFTNIASHDLKTPVRNIASFTNLLERKLKNHPDEDVHQYLGFVRQYTGQMNDLIQDILNFSKISKTGELAISNVNLNAVKDNVVNNILGEKIQSRKVTVRTEGDLPTLKADETHIEQLLQNLLENAITYNEKPDPEVVIGVTQTSQNERHIFVRDNGIGIEPEYQSKVFDMFTRLHSVSEYRGTGLGLAICKKIVNQYGGRIWIDSKKGEGTTVYFSLPAA